MIFFKKSPAASHPPATLLIGLGNPGKKYAGHRHNIGFMVIDRLIGDYHFSAPKKAFGGEIAEGKIGEQKVFSFKPLGYMNTSGGPASELSRFYKVPLERTIVFHDELDLPLGKLRIKRGGGNGGHNGLKSLDAHLGPEYQRVRIGINHPGDKDLVSDHVLSDFTKAERPLAALMVSEISRHIGLLLAGNEAEFMNKIALATKNE
jgi:peptidyl-tRNA hydrolase, PTH1 family